MRQGCRSRFPLLPLLAAETCLLAAPANVTHAAPGDYGTRIPLRPDMMLDESCAGGEVAKLVDEQAAIGDPASGAGKRPERAYFPGWQAVRYPCHALIDLGATYHVRRAYVFNETGQSKFTLSTGTPRAWRDTPVALTGYRDWNAVPLDAATRYVRVTLTGPTALPEICLYGTRVNDSKSAALPPKRKAASLPRPTMDQFVGTNAFIDDPIAALSTPVGFVREYHNWGWDNEGADGETRFQPSGAAGGNAWRFDDYYAALKASGVTVCPAIQQSSRARFPGHAEDAKPVPDGADAELPASYAIHAAHLFQYAARYGSAKVPDRLLDLAPGQPRRSGLGLLHYVENWNEPDKTWKGREGRFTPYELAAMCSADRDGDQGRMGKVVGVRAADPTMRLVMGGLAGANLDYLRAMKFWADFQRNGDFPADVLNLHIYAGDGNEDQAFKTAGISPEAAHLRERLTAITRWRDANLPDREVWVTEFGYDTNGGSPLHAPPIGNWSADEVQAIWLVRSYLAFAAAGVDRAAMFMFRDTDSSDKGGGVFATCGMTTQKGEWKPKPSYDYIATLKTRLKGMRFAGEVPSGRADVTVFRFTGTDGSSAYAVWCPTSSNTHVSGFALPVGGANAAIQIGFTSGNRTGQATPLAIHDKTMLVDVSEKPILVLVGAKRK